jgi:hypothetical protein
MAVLPLITFARIVAAEHSAANSFLLFLSPSASVTDHGITTPPEPFPYRMATALDRFMPIVLAVWLVGVVLLFVRLGIGLVTAQRMMSAAIMSPGRKTYGCSRRYSPGPLLMCWIACPLPIGTVRLRRCDDKRDNLMPTRRVLADVPLCHPTAVSSGLGIASGWHPCPGGCGSPCACCQCPRP